MADFKGATLYTTMSCCPMCTGAAIWFKVGKVVIGDSTNFVRFPISENLNGFKTIAKASCVCQMMAKRLSKRSLWNLDGRRARFDSLAYRVR